MFACSAGPTELGYGKSVRLRVFPDKGNRGTVVALAALLGSARCLSRSCRGDQRSLPHYLLENYTGRHVTQSVHNLLSGNWPAQGRSAGMLEMRL